MAKEIKGKSCRICGSDRFHEVIDFGQCPLVNSLIDKKDLNKKEQVYPLRVVRCKQCSLVQTEDPIDSHQIYGAQDYLYYTGDMPQESQYIQAFDSLVDQILLASEMGDLVVEIGSNDGTILKKVWEVDRKVLGVDPATNVVIRALARGVPTLSAPFNLHNARNIKKEFGAAKVIGGANCIAHIDDLHEVMRGVDELLADNGVFWVECNYWGGMVKNAHYALIYHDHFSYFTLKNWIDIAKTFGMNVYHAEITEAQGDGLSLRVFIDRGEHEVTDKFKALKLEELETDLNTEEACEKYNAAVMKKAGKLFTLVDDLKSQGFTIAGYGAAAKGFSILHLAGINEEHIAYFVDDSPAKQGKFCPVTHIPIFARKDVDNRLPDYFFITAPNYVKVIMDKEKDFLANGGKFILESGEVIG